MALTNKLSAIGEAIRAKTGKEALLTLEQMPLEIASIVSGGSNSGLAYDMGEFILSTDAIWYPSSYIPHSLGEIPDFVLVWTDDFANLSEENPATQQCNLGYLYCKNLFGILQRLSSASSIKGLTINFILASGDYRATISVPNSTSYCAGSNDVKADSIRLTKSGNANYWRAGVKYKYFVSKAWWDIGGATNAE